jgi:hypothetical protein
MRLRPNYSLAVSSLYSSHYGSSFQCFFSEKRKKNLHLDELISLKNVAEAIQTFIRRVTVSFGDPYKTACLLSQDDVGLSLVNVFSHFL